MLGSCHQASTPRQGVQPQGLKVVEDLREGGGDTSSGEGPLVQLHTPFSSQVRRVLVDK